MSARVVNVATSRAHNFSKNSDTEIELIANLGVKDDCHAGVTVQHLSRVAKDPTRPNLRQVHLLHTELLDELKQKGFDVSPSSIGENITTAGIDLLGLPTDTELSIGGDARIRVTGLRNPCHQLDNFLPGLREAVLDRDDDGQLIRKAGIMAVVITGGAVKVGDTIEAHLPPVPHKPLAPV